MKKPSLVCECILKCLYGKKNISSAIRRMLALEPMKPYDKRGSCHDANAEEPHKCKRDELISMAPCYS